MAFHSLVKNDQGQSLVILLTDGEVRTVGDDHPGFASILDALTNGEPDDRIRALLDPATLIHTKTERLTDRITLTGGTLLFDGDPIDGPLADFIIRIAQESDDDKSYRAYVNFLDKLYSNPSAESRDHLFHFMQSHGITVRPDGDIVLYKGVRADGTSIHAGPGIVDGVEMKGNLPNEVGSILEFPRSKVDADRGVGCSTGLHAGTYNYASGFAQGRLLTVAINPRDVVSVPSDHSNAKVRVARYTVLEINEHGYAYDVPVWGDEDAPEDDDFDDYSDDVDDYFEGDEPDEEADTDTDEGTDEQVDAAPAVTDEFERKVQDFLVRIPVILKGGWDKSLNLYVSKHVTAANRTAAREAIRRTGLA